MRYRKIAINLMAGITAPIFFYIKWMPGIYRPVVYKEQRYYGYDTISFDFLEAVLNGFYLWLSFLLVTFIFIPFQLIKDSYSRNQQKFTFAKKAVLLSSMMAAFMMVWVLMGNIWLQPAYYNLLYIVFSIFFGLLFTFILYFTIDKYTERVKQ